MKKVALVTGAGRGLGSELAVQLGKSGYKVAVHYFRSRKGAEKVVQEIETLGGIAIALKADLSNGEEAKRLLERVKLDFGQLDVLINNSGVYHEHNIQQLTDSEWHEGLNTTVSSAFFVTRSALPLLRESDLGRIINIGDSSCDRPGMRDLALSYHVGKTGVYILTRSFAASEAAYGITVNMVSPGFLENSVGLVEAKEIPAGRLGSFDDIINAVEFLLKKESGYITGTNIVVSGGWNLR
ncbi:MAG: SDR family oxidoreductase [Blastochloris sp.]|jgi:3-oxoacyl-[acyl-carrier protein] reductase|nr:SDR family oxidoreductase [Blastochloris sp.]